MATTTLKDISAAIREYEEGSRYATDYEYDDYDTSYEDNYFNY